MKNSTLARLTYWLVALLFPLLAMAQTPTPAPDLAANNTVAVTTLNPALPTIFIAGDSTAQMHTDLPVQGWGVPFADYFNPAKVNIANRARGGRSSRTFITEGHWDNLLAEVKSGDYVLIQFGHNDGGAINEEPPGSTRPLRARGTLPGLGEESQEIDNAVTKKHEVVHTFGWYLRKMIADTKAKGATPVIMSPTARNIWENGKVERGMGSYRPWCLAIAKAAGIQYIDLARIVADKYQAFGPEKVKEYFGNDHTHNIVIGADLNAASVVAGLKGIRKGPYEALLSEKGVAIEADRFGWLNLPEPADTKLPSIFLIGDSTVRNGGGDGEGGQWGWGDYLSEHFDPAKVNIVNRAIGGLTGRTFLNQGHWERALMLVKSGDYLLMQFGTNDGGPINDNSRARGSLKGVGEETEEIDNLLTKQHEIVHTNGWYLRKFVREAKAAGVTPIICSLVPRKIWENGRIKRATELVGWQKQVAQEEGVPFIDLNELVAARYDELGEKKTDALFADEHTHTSLEGAKVNATIVAQALRQLPGDPLKPLSKVTAP